jgi:hypothetical protein
MVGSSVAAPARAFSVSIESKRGSRFLVLTRFLSANRGHFAGKRYNGGAGRGFFVLTLRSSGTEAKSFCQCLGCQHVCQRVRPQSARLRPWGALFLYRWGRYPAIRLRTQVRDNCPEAQCPEVQCPDFSSGYPRTGPSTISKGGFSGWGLEEAGCATQTTSRR